MDLRIYSELLPYEELLRPRTIRLLQAYRLTLVLAVTPDDSGDLDRVLCRYSDSGLRVVLWPMLRKADGRWLNVHTAEAFCSWARQVSASILADVRSEVMLDLEPPFSTLLHIARRWASVRREVKLLRAPDTARMRAEACVHALLDEWRDEGVVVSTALSPPVVDKGAAPAWRTILALLPEPEDAVHHSVMLYTSIAEGWSRGLLTREDVRAWLSHGAELARDRYGARGGVSVGTVGTGIFGDEPVYRCVAELAEDVSIAKSIGIRSISLFDLKGVLARPPAEAWLEALNAPPSTRGAQTLRSRLLWGAVRAVGRTHPKSES